MEFNVKGIVFSFEDLKEINLVDIKTDTISHVHYFHFLPNKKPILLLRAGDYIEPAFVTKYLDKGLTNVYGLELVSDEDLAVYKELWNELRYAKEHNDVVKIRDEILSKVVCDFMERTDKCFLSFVVTAFEEFYFYPNFVIEKLQEESMTLYTRSLLISSISTLVSLCNGLINYNFIRDIYNCAFAIDYGLVAFGMFNYPLSQACETERRRPGTGIELLTKQKRPEGEIDTFVHHSEISYEFINDYQDQFTYPEVIEFVKFHHEKSDGSGFPNGYCYSALSDTEVLLMFCDYLIPFEEHIFTNGDGKKIFEDYYSELCELESKYLLPINRVRSYWAGILEWIKNKEVSA